jgi:hypothetical protein
MLDPRNELKHYYVSRSRRRKNDRVNLLSQFKIIVKVKLEKVVYREWLCELSVSSFKHTQKITSGGNSFFEILAFNVCSAVTINDSRSEEESLCHIHRTTYSVD